SRWTSPCTRTTTRARCVISIWHRSSPPNGVQAFAPTTRGGAHPRHLRHLSQRRWHESGETDMDPILAVPAPSLLKLVEGSVSNAEVSSDEKKLAYFINKCPTEEQAPQDRTSHQQHPPKSNPAVST